MPHHLFTWTHRERFFIYNMKSLLIFVVIVGVVTADVSHLGYNYNPPPTSYGVPNYPTGGSGTGGNQVTYIYTPGGSPSGFHFTGGSSSSKGSGYEGGSQTASSYDYNLPGQSLGYDYNQGSQSFVGSLPTINQESYSSNQYQAEAIQKYQQYYSQVQQQPAQVYKHFYVHEAPADFEPKVRPIQPIVLPPPQKHYKVIFIKTPTPVPVPPQIIPVPQQNEEKTIVYVLSKKPEAQQEIIIPKVEQRPPSKPEVFFIKYNNKQGSQAIINDIVKDYNKGSVGFSGVDVSSVSSASGTSSEQSGGSLIDVQGGGSSVGSGDFVYPQTGAVSSGSGSADLTVNFSRNGVTSQGVPHETYGPPSFSS